MVYEGRQRLGDLFKSRREKGKPGLPTLSVTLNDGLVDRASLDRKTDTTLADADHLLVRKGDIAYNTMRMWQGASGLAEKDGLLSPAYVVLAPKAGIDSRYAAYLFKTRRMVHRFWAYSYGLTADRLRLYYGDFARIPATVPSREDQTKITELLSIWDKAIIATQASIKNSEIHKKALLQKFFASTVQSGRVQNLASLFRSLDAGVSVNTSDHVPLGSYPSVLKTSCITGGKFRPSERKSVLDMKEVSRLRVPLRSQCLLISRMNTPGLVGMCAYVANAPPNTFLPDRLWQGTVKDSIDIRWLSYLFSSSIVKAKLSVYASGTSGSMKNLSKNTLRAIHVAVPSYETQNGIADVLALNDSQLDKLALTLSALRLEKNALMRQLLFGERPAKRDLAM